MIIIIIILIIIIIIIIIIIVFTTIDSQGLLLRGWVDITSGKESYAKKSIKMFDEALSG